MSNRVGEIPLAQIARVARLSYKEGLGTITENEKAALEDYTQIELVMSNKMHELFFKMQLYAHRLGRYIAEGGE